MTHAPGAIREAIFETDLHGYMDGELPVERRAQVESFLATHPNHAARLAEFGDLTLSLHRLYGGGFPANPRIDALTAELCHALRRQRVRRVIRFVTGVMVLAAGAGLASGLFGPGTAEDHSVIFTRQATGASVLSADEPTGDASAADASGETKGDPSPPASAVEPAAAPAPASVPAGIGLPEKT